MILCAPTTTGQSNSQIHETNRKKKRSKKGIELTFRNRLRIRHIRRHKPKPLREARAGDKPRRDGHDIALARELAAPPVGGEELRKLCRGVDRAHVRAGAGLHRLLDGRDIADVADGARGDEDDAGLGVYELVLEEVGEVVPS